MDFDILTTEKIIIKANETLYLLPEKSRELFLKEYETFMEWCQNNTVQSFIERVLLAYFEEKPKQFKS